MPLPKNEYSSSSDNVFTYLLWRGDLLFGDAPFCEVDNLILSMVCYLNFEGIIEAQINGEPMDLSVAVDKFNHSSLEKQDTGFIVPHGIAELAKAVVSTRRFKGTKAVGFTNEVDEEKQFCAMTFLLPDGSVFVAFRGTDDNIVGWKEDFMLAFTSPVPAQVRALHYLEDVAVTFPNAPIRVGGHSKGGNLAFYASVNAKAEVQSRIVLAYSNDGPGFMPEFFLTEGYARIERRLMSFVPQSSIVGVLLHSPKNFHVIHSTQKTILQHDPFSWTVCGPRFRYERSRSAFGVRADVTLDRWITGLSLKERELFIEKMFDLISDSGAKTLTDILSDKVKSIKVIVTSFARLEKKDRDMMFGIMHKLLRAGQESRQLSREMEEESNRLLTESASTPQKKLTLPAMKKKKAPAPKKEKASILPPKKEKATTLPQKKEKKKAPLPKKEKEQIKKAPKKAVASK